MEIAFWLYILFGPIDKEVPKEEKPTVVYDAPEEGTDGVLQEFEGVCPICGNVSYGINGNIVCRNKSCPNYGLAVPVEE